MSRSTHPSQLPNPFMRRSFPPQSFHVPILSSLSPSKNSILTPVQQNLPHKHPFPLPPNFPLPPTPPLPPRRRNPHHHLLRPRPPRRLQSIRLHRLQSRATSLPLIPHRRTCHLPSYYKDDPSNARAIGYGHVCGCEDGMVEEFFWPGSRGQGAGG